MPKQKHVQMARPQASYAAQNPVRTWDDDPNGLDALDGPTLDQPSFEPGAGLRTQALKTIGLAMASRRRQKELSQARLAASLGVSGAHICRLESGHPACNPSIRDLAIIAMALDCQISDLLADPVDF